MTNTSCFEMDVVETGMLLPQEKSHSVLCPEEKSEEKSKLALKIYNEVCTDGLVNFYFSLILIFMFILTNILWLIVTVSDLFPLYKTTEIRALEVIKNPSTT